jgi:hypothetical protein
VFGQEILEAYVSMSADSGPGSVNVSTYGVDAADIGKAAQIVAMAALAAIGQLDPDMDGDLDLDRFDTDDEDTTNCPNCGNEVDDEDQFCAACGTSIVAGEDGPGGDTATETEEEGSMPTDKTGDGAPAQEGLSDEMKAVIKEAAEAQVKEILTSKGLNEDGTPKESDELLAARKLVAEADAGKTAPAPAAAAAATETAPVPFDPTKFMEDVKGVVEEASKAAAILAIREAGPTRKGMVSRSVLEQEPEDVYGGDPGNRGRNLRPDKGVSIRDLEKLADQTFIPVIAN